MKIQPNYLKIEELKPGDKLTFISKDDLEKLYSENKKLIFSWNSSGGMDYLFDKEVTIRKFGMIKQQQQIFIEEDRDWSFTLGMFKGFNQEEIIYRLK